MYSPKNEYKRFSTTEDAYTSLPPSQQELEISPHKIKYEKIKTPLNLPPIALLVIYSVISILTGGIIYGWPFLGKMYQESGFYYWLCDPTDLSNPMNVLDERGLCGYQKVAIEFLYTIGVVSGFMMTIFFGVIFSRFGPKITGALAGLLLCLSCLFLTISSRDLQLYIPALLFMGLIVEVQSLCVVTVRPLFPEKEGLVIGIIMACLDLSWAVPSVFYILFTNFEGLTVQIIFGIYGLCVALPCLITLSLTLPWKIYPEPRPISMAPSPHLHSVDTYNVSLPDGTHLPQTETLPSNERFLLPTSSSGSSLLYEAKPHTDDVSSLTHTNLGGLGALSHDQTPLFDNLQYSDDVHTLPAVHTPPAYNSTVHAGGYSSSSPTVRTPNTSSQTVDSVQQYRSEAVDGGDSPTYSDGQKYSVLYTPKTSGGHLAAMLPHITSPYNQASPYHMPDYGVGAGATSYLEPQSREGGARGDIPPPLTLPRSSSPAATLNHNFNKFSYFKRALFCIKNHLSEYVDRNTLRKLSDPQFILFSIYFSWTNLRNVFYINSTGEIIGYNAETILGIVIPLSFIPTLLSGYILDYFGMGFSKLLNNILGSSVYVFSLLSLYYQGFAYVSVFFFVAQNWNFTLLYGIIAHKFGNTKDYGILVGCAAMLSGVVSIFSKNLYALILSGPYLFYILLIFNIVNILFGILFSPLFPKFYERKGAPTM